MVPAEALTVPSGLQGHHSRKLRALVKGQPERIHRGREKCGGLGEPLVTLRQGGWPSKEGQRRTDRALLAELGPQHWRQLSSACGSSGLR